MPCFLVVTIYLENAEFVKKAAEELGLIEGRDYSYSRGYVTISNRSKEGALKQRYGLLQAESQARKKGYRAQRKVQENGDIQLVLLG